MKHIKMKIPPGGLRPVRPERENSPRCIACPKYANGWCHLMARWANPQAGMCEYGRRKLASASVARSRAKAAKKNGSTKERKTSK